MQSASMASPRILGEGVGRSVFPQLSDRYLGIVLVSEESGPPSLPITLDQFTRGMDVEIRVDGSDHCVPSTVNSSNHAKDINPSLVRILSRENSFQDLWVKENGDTNF